MNMLNTSRFKDIGLLKHLAVFASCVVFCVALSAVVTGCAATTNPDPVVGCGVDKTWEHSFFITGSYVIDSVRTILFEGPPEPTDLCSKEGPVTATFYMTASDVAPNLPDGMRMYGHAWIPGFFGDSTDFVNDGTGEYGSKVSVDLAPHYGINAGFIYMEIVARFRTKGNYKLDSAFFMDQFSGVGARLDYKEHVPSPD